MNIRIGFSIIFTAIIAALAFCSTRCFKSHKSIGKYVGQLDLALIPPLLGNLIILGSSVRAVAMTGCYIYFLGMDLVIFCLVRFTDKYCQGIGNGQQKPTIVYLALAADAVQMTVSIFTHHAFGLVPVDVQGKDYYTVVPHWGQNIHRIVDYAVFGAVILIFIIAATKSSKIYREKYSVVLTAMIVIGLWQTFYIFSRTPVDRSMIGYGIFGLLITYFSIYYRPLRLLDRMLSSVASDMSDGLMVFDPTGKCIWANERAFKLLDIESELEAIPGGLRKKFGEKEYSLKNWSENRILGSGEETRYFTLESRSVSDDNKNIAGTFMTIRDNTKEQGRLRRELYNSTHDSLTGLFTKQYLYYCARQMLDANKETDYAAIFIDVKNFKIVNDVFGTDFGDKALQQIGDWIRVNMTEKCVFGRLAGDTFGVFVPLEQFEKDKTKIEQELNDFTVTDGSVVHHLLIHLGVYIVTEKELEITVMFDRAHLSLSTITDNYKTHIAYYDSALRDKVLWNQRITAELPDAIARMQITPYLQPITDKLGRVVGAEALARWIHPERGFMPPYMFIPVFERNGMILEVDRHMWRCACLILSEWKGWNDDLFISVNISPKDFYYTDVAAEIIALVREYDISPEKLRIEITETVMMNDAEEKMKVLEELRSNGFIVEMDDFGSGFSSLNLLKDMPVDILKIDMKFLSSSNDDNKARTIIRNIIHLSEELGIESLTEGVETVDQFSMLAGMGCRLVQGYYFAKPMPRKDFEEFAVSIND